VKAAETLAAFLDHLAIAVAALHFEFSGVDRAEPTAPMEIRPALGGPGVRKGVLGDFATFALHGYGCRVEFNTSEVVDFDWDVDLRETFDGWRLQKFATSVGETATAAQLVRAARKSRVLDEVAPGWFALKLPPSEAIHPIAG